MVSTRTWSRIGSLGRDRIFLVALGALAVCVLAYLWPGLGLQSWLHEHNYLTDLVWLLLIIVALRSGRRQLKTSDERAFWLLVCIGVGSWAVVAAFFSLFPSVEVDVTVAIVQDLFYLGFYGLMLAATELDPDESQPSMVTDIARRFVGIAGPAVLTLGLFAYLIVVPAVFVREEFLSWVPSLLLYVVLDLFLAFRFLTLSQRARTGRWNLHYALFSLVFYLWGLLELVDAIAFHNDSSVVAGSVLDFLWFLPFVLLVATIRLRHGPSGGPGDDPGLRTSPAVRTPKRFEWSLAPVALLLPAGHFLGHWLGFLPESLQTAHEIVVLAYIAVAGILELTANRLRAYMATVYERAEDAQRLEAIGILAGGIAHDFNNILTIVLGHAQLLQRTLPEDDARHQRVAEILKAGQRAADLAGSLLAFSRRERREASVLDLNTVVAGSVPLLRSLLTDDVRLWIDYAPDPRPVLIDEAQIEQVLLNLVQNARDAISGSGDVYLSTRMVRGERRRAHHPAAVPPGDWVLLEVRDTGEGMAPEVREHAFEPFFTTRARGKRTGLGLAVVYGLVRQGGGEIHLESRPDTGTAVRIFLPPAEESPGPSGRSHIDPTEPAGGARILVAEDDPGIRAFIEEVLTGAGYQVVTARNGRKALEVFRGAREDFDLVLTDVLMPELSGIELAREIHQTDPDSPVLFISGYTDESPIYRLGVEPGVRLIQKPFTPDQLLREVRRVMSLRESD